MAAKGAEAGNADTATGRHAAAAAVGSSNEAAARVNERVFVRDISSPVHAWQCAWSCCTAVQLHPAPCGAPYRQRASFSHHADGPRVLLRLSAAHQLLQKLRVHAIAGRVGQHGIRLPAGGQGKRRYRVCAGVDMVDTLKTTLFNTGDGAVSAHSAPREHSPAQRGVRYYILILSAPVCSRRRNARPAPRAPVTAIVV